MGSFHAEPPPPKQRVERQRKVPRKEVKRITPTQVGERKLGQLNTPAAGYSPMCATVIRQLKKMVDSHQEATEKEVERILGYLKSYYQDDCMFKISPPLTSNQGFIIF